MARSGGSVSVSVVPDASGFSEKLAVQVVPGADKIGAELGRAIGSAMVDALEPSLERIRAKLDELGAREVRVKVKVDDNGGIARAQAELAGVDQAAGSGGGGFNAFGGKIAGIGLAAVAAADVAIPAILAIGAAAAGALAGVGVLALGFSGIGAALQAHGQKAPGGGTGVANAGLSQQSAQIAAAQATQSAQDQLTQATEAQTKAETDLHLARVQALQDLQDLDNKLKDNTLNQSQAAINLRTAQQTLAVDLNAPGANQAQYANQIAQARLNVAAAQQKVNELTLTGTRLTAQDQLAHKQGVNGNPNVLAAQQALIDANHKLAEAQANIGITAQKNAIALQQAANSMVSAAAGANAFGLAMSKLNPIQQQFVEFLLKMKPLFDQIKLAASGFLPGLEQGIKNAGPAFGPILKIVGNVAKAMGSVFANIGAQFATPAGQKFLAFLSTELPKQIIFLGKVFVELGKIVSGIFEAAAPLIHAFDKAFLGFLTSLGKSANGSGLKSFFDSLIPLIKPAFEALSAIGKVIAAALKAVGPALGPILHLITLFATEVGKLVSGPVGQLLVKTFIDVVKAVTPLIPLFAKVIADILPPLLRLFDDVVQKGLIPFIGALIKQIAPILPGLVKDFNDFVSALTPLIGPITQVLIALTPLVPLFVQLTVGPLKAITPLIKDLTPVIGFLARILNDTLGPAISGVTWWFKEQGKIASDVFKAIGDALSWVWENVLKPVFGFIKTIAIDPLKTALGVLGTLWHDVWHGVGTVISDVWKIVKVPLEAMYSIIKHIVDLLPSLPSFTQTVTGQGSTYLPPGYVPPNPASKHNPKGAAVGGPVFAGVPYKVNEFGPELFIPKVDGTIINAVQSGKYLHNDHSGRTNIFNTYGQSDPAATSHAVANRFAARGV